MQYKREPLTDEQADALVNSATEFRERLIILTLLDTGLRVHEFCNMAAERVEWQRNRLSVIGKGGKRRVVPLSPRVKQLLETQFANKQTMDLIPRTVQRVISKVANRAKLTVKVHPHILRHTFAIQSVRKGISLKALQIMLGHSRLETTNIYLNMSPEDALKEYEDKW